MRAIEMADYAVLLPVDLAAGGIVAYDLAPPTCSECGRSSFFRMLATVPTGCTTCDEVLTRHRCTGRPLPFQMKEGAEWTCDGCGAVYRVRVEIEEIEHRMWEVANSAKREGPRVDAPRCHPANGYTVHVKPGCTCTARGPKGLWR